MSIEKITEKLDLIEAQTVAEVGKVKAEAIAAVEAATGPARPEWRTR